MKNGKALKARQLNALQLLAAGTPAYQVAERLEVSTMTIYRWQQLPAFEAKLNAIASSGLEEIAKKLNVAALTALENLQMLQCDMALPITLRVKVGLGVLGAMASLNGVLQKGLRHRVADFDLEQRWNNSGYTFDRAGNPCSANREPCNAGGTTVITV